MPVGIDLREISIAAFLVCAALKSALTSKVRVCVDETAVISGAEFGPRGTTVVE